VFRHAVANFNRGIDHIWNELPVTITFESDWRLAKKVLTQILNESSQVAEETVKARIDAAANRYFIKYMNLTPIVWTSVSDDGIVLTLRYLCDPRKRRSSANDLWEKMLEEFGKLDTVDFAYRTTRHYDNPTEGKMGARAPIRATLTAKSISPITTSKPPEPALEGGEPDKSSR
jgi:small-conductance mechanosensitive channel